MSIELVEGELSEAEAKALEEAFANRDEEAIDRIMSKVVAIHALKHETERLKSRVMQETILNAHWLLHEKRTEEALMLLCPLVATIEGDIPPPEVIIAIRDKLRQVSMEREKSDCGGSA